VTLPSGTRLGPYEIVAPIGAGGMGEVYRARDTRLERTVAVKVLPSHLSASPESRQRFEREARTISQLSHPHICALYDVGREGETEYLVMEYLEGETLSERLARGALPVDQVLRYGCEIADALDKAHRQSVVHRDLKPGNVMLTKSGVKLLDFGLAKALAPVSPATQFTALPTQASPITREGSLLGTLQYMAPEQLEGKEADARADIFAFGAVLHEMATGKKAFSGATQASLIGSILRDEPRPISEDAPLTPTALGRVVRTCLAKDPDDRWQTARDVGLQLSGIQQDRSAAFPPEEGVRARRGLWPLLLAVSAAALVAGAFVGRAVLPRAAAPRSGPVRSLILPPPETEFYFFDANNGAPAVSPDGTRIAFSALNPDDQMHLWVRPLDSLESFAIPGTLGATFPFWSPDGRSLGFFAEGKLKAVQASASASPPLLLADTTEAKGGTWAADGTILFSPGGRGIPILRVSASGGKPEPVTRASPGDLHRWPTFLPDGRRFLYTARVGQGQSVVYVASLGSTERREILREHSDTVYSPPGYLLFHRSGRLMVGRMDPDRGELEGEPVELVEGVEFFPPTGKAIFSASENVLAYAPRTDARLSRLSWFDRTGKEVGRIGAPGTYISPRLSPDGRQLAVSVVEQLANPPDIWLFDTRLNTGTRSTRPEAFAELNPVFSADGLRIFFSSNRARHWNIFEMLSSGSGETELEFATEASRWPNDVSPDGRFLLYREFSSVSRGDLKLLPLVGEPRPRDFIVTSFDEDQGSFSPDGRRVAYVSDESGRKEIFVAKFADPAQRRRVSSDGGIQPRWSRDGRELFYVDGRTIMSVPFEPAEDVPSGPPRRLFDVPIHVIFRTFAPFKYDVTADGRFLFVVRASDAPPPPLVIVTNWQSGLKK
jgi:Tol biopolymer transport system component